MTTSEADDITVTADERREGRSVVSVVQGKFTTSLRVSDGELRRIRDAINAHLSSPPADDVREAQEVAMEREVTRVLSRLAKRDDWAEDDTAIGGMAAHIVSVALEAAREVRPYGTVTDAEALAKAWDEGFELATRNNPNQPHPMAKLNPYRGEALS